MEILQRCRAVQRTSNLTTTSQVQGAIAETQKVVEEAKALGKLSNAEAQTLKAQVDALDTASCSLCELLKYVTVNWFLGSKSGVNLFWDSTRICGTETLRECYGNKGWISFIAIRVVVDSTRLR